MTKKRRGRPPAAAKAVQALEDAGMPEAARVAAQAAGIPARPLTPVEDFALAVRELVTGVGVVGFNLADAAQAEEYAALVATIPSPRAGMKYVTTRGRGPNGDGSRLEVSLRGV